jgi:hypothetical protein
MNRKNLPHRRFSLPLITLLALGVGACGSAPEPGTGAEDTPPSTETPADPEEQDAGPPVQPGIDETVEPSLPLHGGVAARPPGGGHPEETPREK